MNPSDEDLRTAYASIPRAIGPCATPEELAALATGELSESDRSRLADHVVGCARCAADWRILSEAHRELVPSRSPRIRWFALAAAGAVLAVAGLLLVRPSGSHPEAVRGAARRAEAVSPAAGSRLDAPPRDFAWKPPAGASGQRLRLFDASGKRLWESGPLTEPRVALPEAVTASLPDGSYFWTVDVETAAGVEKLGPFAFDLARR